MLPLAAVHNLAGLVSVLFILVALGCVLAAGFAAWENRWVPAFVLLVVAIIAAYLAA